MLKSHLTKTFVLSNELETKHVALSFLYVLLKYKAENRLIIFLQGILGAGKTTWVRFFLQGLGYKGNVKSPTYTLVEEYTFPEQSLSISHFDLYRLKHAEELEQMGFREYLNPYTIIFIEWPEKGDTVIPSPDLSIKLTVNKKNSESRVCLMDAYSEQGEKILSHLI